MGKCLIIFARKYPYSYGEPSLQDELPFHLALYDRIIVLSQDVSKGEETTRTPPKAIEYYNTATTSRRMGRVKDKLKCVHHCFSRSQALQSDEARLKGHLVRRVFLWTFEERCQRLIREAKAVLDQFDFSVYDEVVLYSYWFFANARVAVAIKEYLEDSNCNSVRVVSRAHRYDLYENRNRLNYLPMREYLLERVEKVYACSHDGAEYLRGKYPSYVDKIDVGLLGTLDCGACKLPRTKPFHIVSCCRMVPVKRLERLADALKLIEVPCRWTVIGGGVEGDRYYHKVRKYIQATLADKKNIEVEYAGPLPHDQVFEYYKTNAVDVFINPSRSEGIPQAIMEASSFGIPIIATDVGGTSEIVRDGKNGYLIPEAFENQLLADRISRMMALSDGAYAEMRQNARAIWEENFNFKVNNARFAQQLFGD